MAGWGRLELVRHRHRLPVADAACWRLVKPRFGRRGSLRAQLRRHPSGPIQSDVMSRVLKMGDVGGLFASFREHVVDSVRLSRWIASAC